MLDATSQRLQTALRASIACKEQLLADAEQVGSFAKAVELVVESYRRGGRPYIAGNGGSCADAQHLAAEFVCKLSRPRGPLAAEALTADAATITAIGNDFGFEEVFARQLECKALPADVFIALSTSGKSPNIVRALERCRRLHVPSILFTGRGGGPAGQLADVAIVVPGADSCQVQELHLVLYHVLVACVESALCAGESAQASPRRLHAPAAGIF